MAGKKVVNSGHGKMVRSNQDLGKRGGQGNQVATVDLVMNSSNDG